MTRDLQAWVLDRQKVLREDLETNKAKNMSKGMSGKKLSHN